MKKMTKQQEFDLIFKYPELGFTQENLYNEEKWKSIYPTNAYFGKIIKVPIDFVREYKDYISWDHGGINLETFNEDFIIEFKDKILWKGGGFWISTATILNAPISDRLLEECKDYIDFKKISGEFLTLEQIEKHYKKMTWKNICKNGYLSEDFIRKNKNKITWQTLSSYRIKNFSLEFMQEFDEKIYWKFYCKNRKTLFK